MPSVFHSRPRPRIACIARILCARLSLREITLHLNPSRIQRRRNGLNMGSRHRVAPRYFRINVPRYTSAFRSPLLSSRIPFYVRLNRDPLLPFFFSTDRVTHGACKKKRGGEEGKKMLFQSEKCAARLVDASGKLTFG